MGCCTTVNDITVLYLLSGPNMIARWYTPMPTKGSCLNSKLSGPNIGKETVITTSKAEFLCFLYCTVAGLHPIKSAGFLDAYCPERQCGPVLPGASILKNGYYILKLKNIQWWFQQSTKTGIVGQIVWTDSFRLFNTLPRWTVCLLERWLNW